MSYTCGRVLWLLQMGTFEDTFSVGDTTFRQELLEAVAVDAYPPDSSAHLADDGLGVGGDHDDQLFVVAEWWDVHRARERITADKESREITLLRAAGVTEDEIAAALGTNRMRVRRRFRATLNELLVALGAEDQPDRESRVALCLICGEHPRVRLQPVMRKRRGKPPEPIKPGEPGRMHGRMAAVCFDCLDPDLRPRVLRKEHEAA